MGRARRSRPVPTSDAAPPWRRSPGSSRGSRCSWRPVSPSSRSRAGIGSRPTHGARTTAPTGAGPPPCCCSRSSPRRARSCSGGAGVQPDLVLGRPGSLGVALVVSWAVYLVANLPSRSLAIGAGAVVGGAAWVLLAAATGGVLAPLCCHVVWTLAMIVRPPGSTGHDVRMSFLSTAVQDVLDQGPFCAAATTTPDGPHCTPARVRRERRPRVAHHVAAVGEGAELAARSVDRRPRAARRPRRDVHRERAHLRRARLADVGRGRGGRHVDRAGDRDVQPQERAVLRRLRGGRQAGAAGVDPAGARVRRRRPGAHRAARRRRCPGGTGTVGRRGRLASDVPPRRGHRRSVRRGALGGTRGARHGGRRRADPRGRAWARGPPRPVARWTRRRPTWRCPPRRWRWPTPMPTRRPRSRSTAPTSGARGTWSARCSRGRARASWPAPSGPGRSRCGSLARLDRGGRRRPRPPAAPPRRLVAGLVERQSPVAVSIAECSVEVDATPEEVWTVTSDPRNLAVLGPRNPPRARRARRARAGGVVRGGGRLPRRPHHDPVRGARVGAAVAGQGAPGRRRSKRR